MQTNKLEKHFWVWPIACYLFLGGLGGGILFVAGILEAIYHRGYYLAFGVLAAVVFLGIGSFLLVFELGQPKVFLRVFLSGTAIIRYGAVMLVLAMVFGFVWFLFYLPPEWNLFFFSWTWIRDICTFCMTILGLGIMVYTGVLLSTMKSKPFWNTPALPVLFTVSALSTATAFLAFTVGMWPAFDALLGSPEVVAFISYYGSELGLPFVRDVFDTDREFFASTLHFYDRILIIAETIILLIYVLGMRASGNTTAKTVALEWISGSKAMLFWVGMICVGLLIPLMLYGTGGVASGIIAPVFVLAGGLLLRFLVVYSDKRRLIPGEERCYSRLPKGDEQFLGSWKAPY